ncbi:unnamed protein product [Boreogadus saida]
MLLLFFLLEYIHSTQKYYSHSQCFFFAVCQTICCSSREVNSSLSALAVPDSQILIWRVLLEDRIGADELLINISTNQLLAEGEEAGLVELEQQERFNETQEFSTGHKRKDSEGHTPNRTLGGQRIHRNNRTRGYQHAKAESG